MQGLKIPQRSLPSELAGSAMRGQCRGCVSSCYSSSSTVISRALRTLRCRRLTETARPRISPSRISRIRSSTPIASGRSFLLARTNNGTEASAGRAIRACSSDVAVGSDFGCNQRCAWSIAQIERLTSAASTTYLSVSFVELIPTPTYTIASAPRQYLSHIPRNFGWPCA